MDWTLVPPLPPAELRFMEEADEEFIKIGDDLVADLQQHAGLKESSSILDVGCGYGRVAHALMRSGLHHGSYLGVDILARHVGWCQENLASLAPDRFSFVHMDIQNDRYNSRGSIAPSMVEFPVAASVVDLVVLTSVFTHMAPAHVYHYLHEVARVLKPSGRAYVTFFLLNSSSRPLIRQGRSLFAFPYRLGMHARYEDERDMLHAIAYRETWVRRRAQRCRLVVEAVLPGAWCGRASPRGQDSVVLRRAGHETRR